MNSDRGCLPHWIMTSWPKPSLASCHQQAEQDLAPLASSIQRFCQPEEQSRLIREQHRLIQRLASAPARQSAVGTEAEPLIEDLSSQAANMKGRAKGIF